ncbi:MAG TPA: hypothetical protein VHD35_00930 [Chitinophagaceae bacterium]|nr:hypothetical protein [Chitinophagaceae bacterium]
MQFENFDKKIREAADHHHPAYDEKAWEKMEKLLEKHLPQKKDDRRRNIFFLLLFMLLGGGAWYFISGSGHSNTVIGKADQKVQQNSITSTAKNNKSTSNDSTLITAPAVNANENRTVTFQQGNNDEKTSVSFDRNKYKQSVVDIINNRMKKTVRTNSTSAENSHLIKNQRSVRNIIPDNASLQETGKNPSSENVSSNTDVKNSLPPVDNNSAKGKNILQPTINTIAPEQTSETGKEKKPEATDKKDLTETSNTTSRSKKPGLNNKKSNYFFLSLSAGPDVSAAGINSLGKLKPVFGIGVGFSFHDKFSLRTGFYSVRKVYTASPDEYHPPYNFWTYYPYLNKVDADCRVFEIPLLLSYNFTHSNGHSIFGSTGVSSYLMKRETYNYISKLPSGQITNNEETFNNKNKHYFSVVTLSGGYQRNLNQTISIAAEPYVKIPVDGIGFGKMHLNSAGILFSLQAKPFQERKKK